MQIAVGGCLAQKDRGEIVRGRPGSTWSSAPTTSARCRCCWNAPGTTPRPRWRSSSRWRSSRPRCRPGASRRTPAGCRSRSAATTPARSASCPSLRGKEKDRRPGDILAEVEALVAEGVLEVTLLGQNVNSYGVEFGDRLAFGKLLRACGDDRRAGAGPVHQPAPEGLHRRRDRRDGRDAERLPLAAHAAAVRLRRGAAGDAPRHTGRSATSGSSTGSGRRCPTRRSPPTSSSASPARPRPTSSRPSTWSAQARFAARSPSSTRSAPARRPPTMDGQMPKPVVQERYERLVACSEEITWAENQALVGDDRRGAGRRGRGAQGRAPPAGCPAGPATAGWSTSRPASWPATDPARRHRGDRRSPTPRRTTSTPTGRRCRTGAPGPATPPRPAGPRVPPGVLLGLPTVGAPPVPAAPASACAVD